MIVPYVDDCELVDLEDDLSRIPRHYAHGDWFAHRQAISRKLREPVDPTNADPVYTCFYAPREEDKADASETR